MPVMSARRFGIRSRSLRPSLADAATCRVTQNAAMPSTPVTDTLRTAPPDLHGEGEYWGLAWAALAWLERNVEPGWATLETGSGASTLVFAARGAVHEAVTPDPGEENRIRGRCAELGLDASLLTFRIGPSHEVLARWQPRTLDLVLVDGAHGFPYPILDWWHIASHVRVGGTVLLDDAYLPAVAAIVDFARANDAWRVDDAVSFRTARLTKLSNEPPPFMAGADAAHGHMRFSYLPPHRRIVASGRQRLFSTRAGLWAVRRLRRRA
jgi:Methyltransferase domain